MTRGERARTLIGNIVLILGPMLVGFLLFYPIAKKVFFE